jgi:hypothetical protein
MRILSAAASPTAQRSVSGSPTFLEIASRRTVMGVFVLVGVLVTPQAIEAQAVGSGLSFGVIGGVNFSTLSGDDISGNQSKVGFTIGGFLRKSLSASWVFQSELLYVAKGTEMIVNGVTGKVNLNYLELPLLVRGFAGPATALRPFLELGPALSLKTGCTVSAQNGSITQAASCSNFGEVKSFDAGLIVGAGFETALGNSTVGVGVRYNFGLLDIRTGSTATNRNLQVLASIRF